MEYISKTVRCNEPGLTQEQALASLYSHYGEDIRVSSVKRRGDSWVVAFKHKVAEFPPKKDEAESADEGGGEETAPPSDEGSGGGPTDLPAEPGVDGPPSDGEGDKKEKPEAEILHLLHEIAQALGVSGGLEDKLPPEGEQPGPLPPGPDAAMDMGAGPDGPPMGGPGLPPAAKKPTKLKPGEVLPSQTAVGSPAFASKQAATITVESDKVDPRSYKASQAQAELEGAFPGYRVKQMKFDRTASVYRALLSIH
jgi:hypothetical protein